MSESAYTELLERASRPSAEAQRAFGRLQALATSNKARAAHLDQDERTNIIFAKHLGDRA